MHACAKNNNNHYEDRAVMQLIEREDFAAMDFDIDVTPKTDSFKSTVVANFPRMRAELPDSGIIASHLLKKTS